MSLWDKLSKEDLGTDGIAELADAIGMDAVKQIIRTFGGEAIYIPKTESVLRASRDRAIYEEFDGSNYRELARKYNLSVPHIRVIVQSQRKLRPKGARQEELF
jgi:Mor family transcriptional regulator